MEPYKSFAAKRIFTGILIAAAILIVTYTGLKLYDRHPGPASDQTVPLAVAPPPSESASTAKKEEAKKPPQTSKESGVPVASEKPKVSTESQKTTPQTAPQTAPVAKPKGVLFVQAVIRPMTFELNERFWRWRPNDILDVTDNVNNFQLGVLEVTRRTAVNLAEKLSRTGDTASFDPNLERAMNWFMIKADRFWFPSAESKYREALDEMNRYSKKLEKREATFYTRPDNLIPLLSAYRDLLGSCDENLVKEKEETGEAVSFFKADDYFYYAQGVASTMGTILEAIMIDFQQTLEIRHGVEPLRQAIESCRRATQISPWIVTDGGLSSIFANHRANMAAPISHARFYLGVLIRTLST